MTIEKAIERIKRNKCLLDRNDNCHCQWVTEGFGTCDECEFGIALKALEQHPVITGRWIKYGVKWGGMQMWKCSICGSCFNVNVNEYSKPPHECCPNCKARMVESEE